MTRGFYRVLAEIVFAFHILVLMIILFGGICSGLFYTYGLVLFLTLFSWLVFGHCFLIDFEFYFRGKSNPNIVRAFDVFGTKFAINKSNKVISLKTFISISAFDIELCYYIKFLFRNRL